MSVEHEVCKKILDRRHKGFEKYGKTMERDDLTELEWLNHYQQELMDGANYVEKLIQLKEQEMKTLLYKVYVWLRKII
jgi:hypothetical protein